MQNRDSWFRVVLQIHLAAKKWTFHPLLRCVVGGIRISTAALAAPLHLEQLTEKNMSENQYCGGLMSQSMYLK